MSGTMQMAKMSVQGEREIRVERIFNATRERVWRAFTEPDQLAQWWGRGHRLTVEKHELVRGGHWRFIEHTDEGDFGFEGRHRVVEPPRRLEGTFEWDGMPGHVIVTNMVLDDLGDGRTKLVSTMTFFTGADRDGMLQSGMEKGMNESYAALDRVLAQG